MKFDEIIQILGDNRIQEADYETHTVYRLVYELGGRKWWDIHCLNIFVRLTQQRSILYDNEARNR